MRRSASKTSSVQSELGVWDVKSVVDDLKSRGAGAVEHATITETGYSFYSMILSREATALWRKYETPKERWKMKDRERRWALREACGGITWGTGTPGKSMS